jgi:exonuclease VII small subunit
MVTLFRTRGTPARMSTLELSKLEESLARLERAVARLEKSLGSDTPGADYAALLATTESVAARLDGAILRLDRALET